MLGSDSFGPGWNRIQPHEHRPASAAPPSALRSIPSPPKWSRRCAMQAYDRYCSRGPSIATWLRGDDAPRAVRRLGSARGRGNLRPGCVASTRQPSTPLLLVGAAGRRRRSGEAQPLEDLARALRIADEQFWCEAGDLARRVDARRRSRPGSVSIPEGCVARTAPGLRRRVRPRSHLRARFVVPCSSRSGACACRLSRLPSIRIGRPPTARGSGPANPIAAGRAALAGSAAPSVDSLALCARQSTFGGLGRRSRRGSKAASPTAATPPSVPKKMSIAESRRFGIRPVVSTRSPTYSPSSHSTVSPNTPPGQRPQRPERPGQAAPQVLGQRPAGERAADAVGERARLPRIGRRIDPDPPQDHDEPRRERHQRPVGEPGEPRAEQPGEAKPAHDHGGAVAGREEAEREQRERAERECEQVDAKPAGVHRGARA